jgi:hypothetical protein
MVQRVHCATHDDGISLDLIITHESQSDLIADVTSKFVNSSDHRGIDSPNADLFPFNARLSSATRIVISDAGIWPHFVVLLSNRNCSSLRLDEFAELFND